MAIHRRNKMVKRLQNKDFSFLVPNCLGGMLLHDLSMPFLSPMVNLMLHQKDFVRFLLDIDYYLKQELCFYNDPYYVCPCAKLGEPDKEIIIHFTHYTSEEDADANWKKRIKRIRWNNLFIFLMKRDGLSEKEIIKVGSIKAKGLVVFTAHEYPDIPYACYIPKYKEQGQIGNVLVRSYLDDSKEYEKYFDFVKWFNEANGGNYDCKPYLL